MQSYWRTAAGRKGAVRTENTSLCFYQEMCDEEEDAYQKKCSVFVAEELGLYVLLSLLSP